MEYLNLVIIGAGPAGCAAALEASTAGLDNITLFEKEELPRLKACAGGISSRAELVLKEMGLWDELELQVQPITGARLVFPSGREFIVRGDESASVMNRRDFDNFLQTKVEAKGVEIRESTIVKEITPVENAVHLVTENKITGKKTEVTAKYVIVTAGASSKFHFNQIKTENITTCTAWFEGLPFNANEMEMVFTRKLSPHYGWLFPESDGSCNIGLCVYGKRTKGKSIIEIYNDFLKEEFGSRMDGAVMTEGKKIHPISPAKRFNPKFPKGILTAGDTAGLINAYTGEGISSALFSGRQAAASIIEGQRKGWSWTEICDDYVGKINKTFAGKLRSGFFLCRTGPMLLSLGSLVSRIPILRPMLVKLMSKL